MISTRAFNYLNRGDSVVAELSPSEAGERRFVRIRPIPKPGVPREERRYLNSTWSPWEYWDFEFRRLSLRQGWETDEWNYDKYISESTTRLTRTEPEFEAQLGEWSDAGATFVHVTESAYPE